MSSKNEGWDSNAFPRKINQKYRKGELKDDERFYNLKWMQKEVVK